MIKIGKVISINENNCSARVKRTDTGVITEELKLLVPFTLNDKAYYMPAVNETVVCALVNESQGFILGSFYAETRQTNDSGNMAYVEFKDGTLLKYNQESKELDIKSSGVINITAKNLITIHGGDVLISGSTVNISGETQVEGNLNVRGNLNVEGVIVSQ